MVPGHVKREKHRHEKTDEWDPEMKECDDPFVLDQGHDPSATEYQLHRVLHDRRREMPRRWP